MWKVNWERNSSVFHQHQLRPVQPCLTNWQKRLRKQPEQSSYDRFIATRTKFTSHVNGKEYDDKMKFESCQQIRPKQSNIDSNTNTSINQWTFTVWRDRLTDCVTSLSLMAKERNRILQGLRKVRRVLGYNIGPPNRTSRHPAAL